MLELIILGIGLLFLSTQDFNPYIRRIFFYLGFFLIGISFTLMINQDLASQALHYLTYVFFVLMFLIALFDLLGYFGIIIKNSK
ncbi:MAG: hypothetical protein QXO07_01275 [Candidatus Aenigmatarchaeota archaeon]